MIKESIEKYKNSNINYYDSGVKILELANKAYLLYKKQNPGKKRRLLDNVVSNCTLTDVSILPNYKKPFDLIASGVKNEKWRREWDSNPRGSCDPTGFRDQRLRPLGHPSS